MTDQPTRADWQRAVQALKARIETASMNAAPITARMIQTRLARAMILAKLGYAVEAYASISNG
jgi:hypothetical protein